MTGLFYVKKGANSEKAVLVISLQMTHFWPRYDQIWSNVGYIRNFARMILQAYLQTHVLPILIIMWPKMAILS